MANIKTEQIELHKLPMSQRKRVGMLCQHHMESKHSLGTVDSLRAVLKEYIDAHPQESTAASWMLARLTADKLAEINCRRYICELLYGCYGRLYVCAS